MVARAAMAARAAWYDLPKVACSKQGFSKVEIAQGV